MNRVKSSDTETKKFSHLAPSAKPGCIVSLSGKMRLLSRLRWRYVAAGILLLALSSAALVYWQTRRALRAAAVEVRSNETIRFTIGRVVPVSSSFEWISAPEAFTGAAVFKGEFYICGASGLLRYDSHG
jgi:hypothetical protein